MWLSRLHSLRPPSLIAILDTDERWLTVAAFFAGQSWGELLPTIDLASVLLSMTVRDASELVPLSVNAFLLFLMVAATVFPLTCCASDSWEHAGHDAQLK